MILEECLSSLEQAVTNCDVDGAKEAAKRVLEAGVDPTLAIDRAAKAVRKVGERFEKGDALLPHLVMAGDAMSEVAKILEKAIPKERMVSARRGIIVLGTVKGDLHDIGKNIVGALLVAAGFDVHDIGKDVPYEAFLDKAEELGAQLIATSALMTITRPAQRELIEELKKRPLRDKVKVLVGGGTVTPEWAQKIGADGYGRTAADAVKEAERLLGP